MYIPIAVSTNNFRLFPTASLLFHLEPPPFRISVQPSSVPASFSWAAQLICFTNISLGLWLIFYILMFQEISENGCLRMFMACGWYGALGRGCQFWDVHRCAIYDPLEGLQFKFQKWGLRKWGYGICFFKYFNMLHMLSYEHQGGWGVY